MTLQSSGAISIANINTELGVASTTTRSLNDTVARNLAGVASGAISMSNFYGKSSVVSVSYTFTTNTQNASLNVATIGGYVSGVTTITVTVNSGIYLWSSSTGTAGLYITGRTGGDTLTLVNNGYIIGRGGAGGGLYSVGPNSSQVTPNYGLGSGGPALSIGCSLTVQNNSYIAGGGGGGGSTGYATTGGGGAGGGNNGLYYFVYNGPAAPTYTNANQGNTGGGSIGSSGARGVPFAYSNLYAINGATGGGGGRILPGTTTPTQSATNAGITATSGAGGGGGSAGGTSPVQSGTFAYGTVTGGSGGAGGSAGGGGGLAYGTSYYGYVSAAAGGGGWGASGGSVNNVNPASTTTSPGAGGGNCVNLNGFTVTWSATGTRYGAIA